MTPPTEETRRLRRVAIAYPALIGLLGAFIAIATLTCREPELDAAPQIGALPDHVAGLAGESLLFCQNEQCLRSFTSGTLAGRTNCPACSGPLATVSLGEKRLLPRDTGIRKRLYGHDGIEQYLVTIVTAGTERRSIHKPLSLIHI